MPGSSVVKRLGVLVVVVLAVGLAVLGTGATHAGASGIQPDRDVTFVSNGITIRASYRAPADGATGVPAVVIIGGTGDVDRDGNSPLAPGVALDVYRWMADRLSALGIASIRYDKIGTGATGLGQYTADPSPLLSMSYDQLRLQTARDALSYVAAQPGIDAHKLLLVGHSEGGAVALSVVADPGSAPAPVGVALIEPAYTHILDIIFRQVTDQVQEAVQGGAMTVGDAATLTTYAQTGVDQIRNGTPPFPAPGPIPLPDATGFTADVQAAIQSNFYGSDPAQMVLTHSFRTRYGKEYDLIDPAALAATVKIPTLITCGTKDFNTPCGDGTPGSGVAAVASSFPSGVATFVQLPNTVHVLRDVGSDNPTELADQAKYPFSDVLATAFDTFFKAFAPPPPSTTSTSSPSTPTTTIKPGTLTPKFTG